MGAARKLAVDLVWQAETEEISPDIIRFRLRDSDGSLSYGSVARLWQTSPFASWFTELLAQCGFEAFYWECAPVSRSELDNTFEFVLVRAPSLEEVTADPHAFEEHFVHSEESVIVFANLGGDATLVVPRQTGRPQAYAHLAVFCRMAPTEQRLQLWNRTAEAVLEQLSERPLWLSTSGLGVYWLHIRLDSRPKYYQFREFRSWRNRNAA